MRFIKVLWPLLLIGGCGNSGGQVDTSVASGNGSAPAGVAVAPAATPMPQTYNVTFKVTGSVDHASVTYDNGWEKDSITEIARLPWEKSFTVTRGTYVKLYALSAPNGDITGYTTYRDILCQVYVDQKLIAQRDQNGNGDTDMLVGVSYLPHPATATALCIDATYSDSKGHTGACSGHGGVFEFYD